MKSNITIGDIKGIEVQLGIRLSEEQRDVVLREYQRLVLDRAEDWNVIIENLIIDIS
jgi:hypothetical protein